MNTVQQDSGNPTANLKFYRRILPGLRRLRHLRCISVRNINNESVEKSCQLYFTIHCNLDKSTDSNTEVLVYTSETLQDTVNPEWNEFGNPIDILEQAKEEKEFTLRIWNKIGAEVQKVIESRVNVQDLEYICPLEATDLKSNNIDSFPKVVGDFILANMSTTVFTNIFNALPFNAILFQMQDGYFATHEVCSLLRKSGTLKTVDFPSIPAMNPVDFHFTLTTLQQLYLQQSRTKQNDDRMALMKEMVKDVMSAPMALNEKSVTSKCLANDIVQLREEEATLREHLEEDQAVRADARFSDAVTSESGSAPK